MTQVIATLGPSCDDEKIILQMVDEGVRCLRINCSHSSHKDIYKRFRKINLVSKKLNKRIKVFADLQGSKIRLGNFKNKKVYLKDNSVFILVTHKVEGNSRISMVDYPDFHKYVRKYDRVFLDDGKIELVIEDIRNDRIFCRVLLGGVISSRKGVSVLNRTFPLPALTNRDRMDIRYAVSLGINCFAQSFVRNEKDIVELRDYMSSIDVKKYFLISKIEDRSGFLNIDKIMSLSDAVMVARGDLGVSVERSIVPIIQKEIIEKCKKAGVISIVATQMLDSMIEKPYPTRAEVNDVAVSVMHGADYLLLSGETAVGRFPVIAVKEMMNIIKSVTVYMKKGKIAL